MISSVKYWLILGLFLISSNVAAGSYELKSLIRTDYPKNLLESTVEGLIQYILEGTGYKLYIGKNSPSDANEILSIKPGFQRKGVLMTRFDAILMAIGNSESLVVDHEKRLVSVTKSPI